MKNTLYLFFLVLILFGSCNDPNTSAEIAAVNECYDSYKNSILSDKGEMAVDLVDSRTLKYYNDILFIAKHGDSSTIAGLNLVDRITVFSLRHQASKEEFKSFKNGTDLFIYAVNSGMVGKNSVQNNVLGIVDISEDFAKGELVTNGKSSKQHLHFYKENDTWKIDLTSLLPFANAGISLLIKQNEMDENTYIFMILEAMTGRTPKKEIWQPVH